MVWLTLLAWGLHQEFKKDQLADEMPGAGFNEQDYQFEDTSTGDGLEDARSKAREAEKRASEAEGEVRTLRKVELRTQDLVDKCCCF